MQLNMSKCCIDSTSKFASEFGKNKRKKIGFTFQKWSKKLKILYGQSTSCVRFGRVDTSFKIFKKILVKHKENAK